MSMSSVDIFSAVHFSPLPCESFRRCFDYQRRNPCNNAARAAMCDINAAQEEGIPLAAFPLPPQGTTHCVQCELWVKKEKLLFHICALLGEQVREIFSHNSLVLFRCSPPSRASRD